MPFQLTLLYSEQFAWDAYPKLLESLGFKEQTAGYLMAQELRRHEQRVLRALA